MKCYEIVKFTLNIYDSDDFDLQMLNLILFFQWNKILILMIERKSSIDRNKKNHISFINEN